MAVASEPGLAWQAFGPDGCADRPATGNGFPEQADAGSVPR